MSDNEKIGFLGELMEDVENQRRPEVGDTSVNIAFAKAHNLRMDVIYQYLHDTKQYLINKESDEQDLKDARGY